MGYVRAQRFVCLAPLVDVAVVQERLCWIGHGVSSAARSASSAARWFKIAVRTVVDAEDAVRLASGSRSAETSSATGSVGSATGSGMGRPVTCSTDVSLPCSS